MLQARPPGDGRVRYRRFVPFVPPPFRSVHGACYILGMTTTAAPLFDLLAPASGNGRTHLRAESTPAILCRGAGMTRATRFTQTGIVPAGSATCEACNRAAQAIAIEHTARTTGQVLTPEF